MLATLTAVTDLITIGLTLWLGLYILARGFPNGLALRAVFSLLALSAFILGDYTDFFVETPEIAAMRAVLLIIGLACWYSLTFQLLSIQNRQRFRWLRVGILTLCLATTALLLTFRNELISEHGNPLYLAHAQPRLPYVFYGCTQVVTSSGMLFNLLAEKRLRATVEGKSLLFASIFPCLVVVYEVFALVTDTLPIPRLIQHSLILIGVFTLGISVARHASLIERRTILQDFPATGILMVGLVAVYVVISLKIGIPAANLGIVITVAIMTHSLYDIGREALDRLRSRQESQLRKQWHLLESADANQDRLQLYLQDRLHQLCGRLNTAAGLIAVRDGEKMVVLTSRNSLAPGTETPQGLVVHKDVFRAAGQLDNIVWISAAGERQSPIALIGIGVSRTKLEYSAGDLELLAEFADQVGMVVSIAKLQPGTRAPIPQLLDESRAHSMDMKPGMGERVESLAPAPEAEFIRMVEDCLRNYTDFIRLGQSPLAEWMGLEGHHHTERGKQLQKVLREAIDSLRPAGPRPEESPPKGWYSYVVLHDAYVSGIPNRAIQGRLFISEGTFNRIRRNALRSVARWLVEENWKKRKQS